MIRPLAHAALLTLLLSLAPLGSRALAQESIETFGGAWETDWGETWAFQSEDGAAYEGYYLSDNGRFVLEFTDHVFEGYWAEDMSDVECQTPLMGSYHWGTLQLANSEQYPGFEMVWGYCDGPLDRVWSFTERLPDGL